MDVNTVVDRENRDRLANAIDRYMDERTTAFKFDEEINDIWSASEDGTVAQIAAALWYHYDDCKDHYAGLSKVEWDYFQRLILLLKSDAHLIVHRRRIWSTTQIAALIAVAVFLACIPDFGWGWQLLMVTIPLGIVSIIISRIRQQSRPELSPEEISLLPFDSVSKLISVRRSVRDFSKRRYPHPRDQKPRNIRGPIERAAFALHQYFAWLKFSPLVLLFQMLPEYETNYQVVED